MQEPLAPFAQYKGRSVLITGGLGFIGSNLAHRLAEIGDVQITILDALFPEQGGSLYNIASIKNRVNLQIADMRDSSMINHLVGGVDYIFNLAGSISHVESMTNPQCDLELNCASQLSLLEACRMFNPQAKIVFTSTRQVYGRPVHLPIDEHHRLMPMDINGIHKIAAESYHLLYHRVYGLPVTCLRLSNTFGPRQKMTDDRQGFIAWFIRQAMDGETIKLYGDGKQQRDLNYVDDVVDALLLAGEKEITNGEVYNLGNDHPIRLVDLANELISLTGRGSIQGVPFPPERQLIDIGNYYSSFNKIENHLGWRPRTPLTEGLKCTIEFYNQHKDCYWNPHAHTVFESNATVSRD